MYLRATSSKLADGSKVKYVQLCHNQWDKDSGYSKTKVIYSFGREDNLDRELLERLVDSIQKYLNPDEAKFKTGEIGKAVMDRGFASDSNMKYLQRAGGHFIIGEKLRSAKKEVQEALGRQGRYQEVRDNLHVKGIIVGDGPSRKRYILAYNPKEAKRQEETRNNILNWSLSSKV